ncbi:NUDIX hydrolase domain-like protein [Schizophyllum fasciatum]
MSDTVVNLFGGSPLNRLSWLRPSQIFLDAATALPSTRWLLFNGGRPLVSSPGDNPSAISLAYLSTPDVEPFIGARPWFGQNKDGGALTPQEATEHTAAARHRGPPIVFLGLDEPRGGPRSALPSADFADPARALANLHGTPYFALDVAGLAHPDDALARPDAAGLARPDAAAAPRRWAEPRALAGGLGAFDAAVFAEARSMLDWHARSRFCPACGARTYALWGGWKIACASLLPWADADGGSAPCPTTTGLHNFTHPRTDPVVIMLAIDATGDKILLGRNKKFSGRFYSALAGFMEPGESVEDAVAREMWEEAGVRVSSVTYHSSQPWPYPANLMVGCYARADAAQPLRTDLDNELEDARWCTRAQVLGILRHPRGAFVGGRPPAPGEGTQAGAAVLAPSDPSSSSSTNPSSSSTTTPNPPSNPTTTPNPADPDPPFQLPPASAIAGVLIRDWAEGRVGFARGAGAGGGAAL